jgi:acyl carrier protein
MSDTENLREQLIEIIAKEGMIDREKLVPEATIETIGMASYDMVMVLMALEEKFGVYISVDQELTDVKTLDELLTVLSRRIEEQKDAAPGAAPPPEGAPIAAPAFATGVTDAATAAAATVSTSTLAAAMAAESDDDEAGEPVSGDKSGAGA